MARLHEHQGKSLLAARGVTIPRGRVASSPAQAREIAAELAPSRAVLKIQAWTTGRAALGGVAFANSPGEAETAAKRLLAIKVGAFPVEQLLVEEAIDIKDELFVSITIDDAARAPLLLLSLAGGSGVEDRAASAHMLPIDVRRGVDPAALRALFAKSTLSKAHHEPLAQAVENIIRLAKETDARSVEVNPLVTTKDGRVVAADCRITIDDYAVFRHPELGIDIARELDHPPTELERIAYRIEQADHRGTFYFARLPVPDDSRDRMVGFHGAGGGGSMMSMDAISKAGFIPANFTDTSGNPSAAKVYAAARTILAQEGIVGYFGSGSGVASQEQYHSAYGIAKAFLEMNLSIPAVIRLGGNSEDRAVEILQDACRRLPAKVEGYRKDDTPAACAERFAKLVTENKHKPWKPGERISDPYVGASGAFGFAIRFGDDWGGTVWVHADACTPEITALVVKHSGGVLKEENGKPALALSPEDAATKDSEMIACEIECRRAGHPVVFVDLPIAGLDGPPRRGIAAAAESGAASVGGESA